MSPIGTNRTNRAGLTMSVDWGRAEVKKQRHKPLGSPFLDLIQMPGTEPDQITRRSYGLSLPDDPQHRTHLALADVDGHLGHPDGRFRRVVPTSPPGPVMVVRNHEVPYNPIPALDAPGFRFTRNQNGVIIARCTTCHIGLVVGEASAERARFAMSAHQDLHGSHLRRGRALGPR